MPSSQSQAANTTQALTLQVYKISHGKDGIGFQDRLLKKKSGGGLASLLAIYTEMHKTEYTLV